MSLFNFLILTAQPQRVILQEYQQKHEVNKIIKEFKKL